MPRSESDFRVFKIGDFLNAVENIPEDCHEGGYAALEDILEIWEEKAKPKSLYDTGQLEDNLSGDDIIEHGLLDLEGTIRVEAHNPRDGFDYAFYWHALGDAGIQPKNPSRKGSVGNPLTQVGEKNDAAFKQIIQKRIRQRLAERGWF